MLKEIEEQKKELIKREEKLREIEAKLSKGDTSVLNGKVATRDTRDTSTNRSHRSSDHGRGQPSTPAPSTRRNRYSTGEYSDAADDEHKVGEIIA